MATFRRYTTEELRGAAAAYGLDPAFVEAVYEVESSRGTNPKAMTARSVKRKRDSTIVRGPFQLEDDTTSDLIARHKLGNVDVDDPDVHLDLALRLMQDLKKDYNGDYRKMAQAYLGGPGGVTNSMAKDELGTTTGDYGSKIMNEMAKIKGSTSVATNDVMPPMQDFGTDDIFGMSDEMMAAPMPSPDRFRWSDLVAENRGDGLGIAPSMGGDLPNLAPATNTDIDEYVRRLASEEMDDREFVNG